MTEWYYADRQRRQIGPQSAEVLAQRFRAGEIDAATLVWRDGLPAWQPLGSLRGELGLDEAPATLDFRVEPTLGPAGDVPAETLATAGGAYSPYAAPATGFDSHAGPTPVHGGDVVMGGLWRRVAASFLDGIVTAILTYALLIPLMLLFGLSLSSLGLPALYFAWMHSSGTQASLGKMAVGVKVVRTSGEPVGFWRALLRYVAYFLFVLMTCGIGVLISGLMVAFTERKQALHDMLCDTLVVDKWAFTDRPEWQERGLGTVTVVILVLFGLFIAGALAVGLAMLGLISSMKG